MKENLSKKQLREFGFIAGIGFPIFLGLVPAITGNGFKVWTLCLGVAVFLSGLISPNLLKSPYKIWIKLGHLLGWINSRIIFCVIYTIILLPIALLMRCIGYDPLRLIRKGKITYRENRQDHSTNLNRIF
ncbi:SxtJ family membrane protein [Prochlorococcus sp. AH-736-F09]|nr:SxtJ family membrane protein [Prochlorococcus sp. AH-736-F09]